MKFPMIAGFVTISASATLSVYTLAAITSPGAGLAPFVLSDGSTIMGQLGPINGGFLP